MKKIIAILLTAILLFGVCSVSVFASEADDINACKNKTDYADYFFGGYNVDYDANFVCSYDMFALKDKTIAAGNS